MKNPESMDYTTLSTHQKVIEANALVLTEAQKVIYEATQAKDFKLMRSANEFAKNPRQGRLDT